MKFWFIFYLIKWQKNTWHFLRQKRNTPELFLQDTIKNHLLLFFTSLRKNKLFNLSIFSWPVSKKRLFSIYSWIVDTVESHLVPEWQLTALHIELFGMWGHIKSLILQERPFCLIQNNVHQLSSKFLQKLVSINYRLVLIPWQCFSV